MAFSAKLELKQGQQLVMTPQLQQAIRLLQLSNIELNQFVDTELERNPLLERDDAAEAETSVKVEADGEVDHAADGMNGAADDAWLDLAKPADTATLDTEYENVFPDTAKADLAPDIQVSGWASLRQRANGLGDDEANLEAFATAEPSLKDHLTQQMVLALKNPVERLIGHHLIDMVDEAGYFRADVETLAQKLGAPLEMVERILGVLQSLDPPGVFARSLAECLALQLKEQNRYDPQIAKLLDNLHLLGAHNLAGLKRAVGADMEELGEMIDEIKRLNPKPGLKFGAVQMQPVVPDILVRAALNGSWHIELNTDTLPRVLVNRSYYTKVTKGHCSEQDKGYLIECLQTANWLVKSLDQRARTILRSRRGDRPSAGQLLRPRRPALETVEPQDGRGRHLDAREHGLASHLQQVHGNAARHLRAQVLFHLRHCLGARRGIAFLRGSPPPHQADDRPREPPRGAFRRQNCGHASDRRGRHRAAHGCQVPRGDAHSLLRSAPQGEDACRAAGAPGVGRFTAN